MYGHIINASCRSSFEVVRNVPLVVPVGILARVQVGGSRLIIDSFDCGISKGDVRLL